MKKKFILIIITIIVLINCTGCSLINKIIPFWEDTKPSASFYTDKLKADINLKTPKKVSVFYREYFKEFTFPETEVEDIISFIKALKAENFIEKPEDLPETYKYKVYLSFDKKKYALTIFDEKYISIYEWDGDYEVDYLDINDIPLSINIYGICKYFTEE